MDILTNLIREKEPDFTGSLESLIASKPTPKISLIGNRSAETAITLTALEMVLGKETFASVVTEAADSLDTYEVADKGASIDTAKQAKEDAKEDESAKGTVDKITALKFAENAKDPMYEEYLELSSKLADLLEKIDEKYAENVAKECYIILNNARKKCTYIQSNAGKVIGSALESVLSEYK